MQLCNGIIASTTSVDFLLALYRSQQCCCPQESRVEATQFQVQHGYLRPTIPKSKHFVPFPRISVIPVVVKPASKSTYINPNTDPSPSAHPNDHNAQIKTLCVQCSGFSLPLDLPVCPRENRRKCHLFSTHRRYGSPSQSRIRSLSRTRSLI